MRGMHQSGEQSGCRVTGQNGHGSAKQAVPRTAPSARTLSAVLTDAPEREPLNYAGGAVPVPLVSLREPGEAAGKLVSRRPDTTSGNRTGC